ncbi:hypothetical protein DPEC_G00361760 [Dallia pectoralis]|nr:hypothetical protein DPEC_G00361760 [Dallia pectoralis]
MDVRCYPANWTASRDGTTRACQRGTWVPVREHTLTHTPEHVHAPTHKYSAEITVDTGTCLSTLLLLREDFDPEKMEQELQALSLLDQITSYLLRLAQQNPNAVEKMRLQHISKSMVL